ncbi:glycine cleavage system protein H [Paenibacillus selenitireducens]|uniref:Glycine cleavage system H protein n=1 Tax=Paenibacillus selenitireducens TaxID=1324314 RepID=A0A1T2XDP3_9BACL|nr:glycine cleavage system protein GcvH [Paenibacillus selenitireducens]OPA77733.1 glycine cleavage system protein H [Paenibacillus selenitireducens]
MSEVKDNLRYSKEHEWAEEVGDQCIRIGISDYAQHQLGDIVFVEFPEIDAEVNAGDSMGSIESVKTVSELYSPVTGRITRINTTLESQPELVNQSPYEAGWLVEVQVSNSVDEALKALLTPEQYRTHIES